MTVPILRSSGMPQNGKPPDIAMMLVTCNICGHQILVPGSLAQTAAQQHDQHCVGRKVDRLAELVMQLLPEPM